MNLERIHSKYPFLVMGVEDKYYDRLGAKSDLLYVAVQELDEKISKLEEKVS